MCSTDLRQKREKYCLIAGYILYFAKNSPGDTGVFFFFSFRLSHSIHVCWSAEVFRLRTPWGRKEQKLISLFSLLWLFPEGHRFNHPVTHRVHVEMSFHTLQNNESLPPSQAFCLELALTCDLPLMAVKWGVKFQKINEVSQRNHKMWFTNVGCVHHGCARQSS